MISRKKSISQICMSKDRPVFFPGNKKYTKYNIKYASSFSAVIRVHNRCLM